MNGIGYVAVCMCLHMHKCTLMSRSTMRSSDGFSGSFMTSSSSRDLTCIATKHGGNTHTYSQTHTQTHRQTGTYTHTHTHNTYKYLHCIKLADVTRAHYWLLGGGELDRGEREVEKGEDGVRGGRGEGERKGGSAEEGEGN